MNPTLKDLDMTYFKPYENRSIRKGDVIVFQHHDSPDRKIIHRVISIDQEGIRTQGDNNRNSDPVTIHPRDVIGQVTVAKRGTKEIVIRGGHSGYFIFHLMRSYANFTGSLKHLAQKPYWWLSSSKVLNRILFRFIEKRMILYYNRQSSEIQLQVHGIIIGRRRNGAGRWQILPPFHVFVDQSSLDRKIADSVIFTEY